LNLDINIKRLGDRIKSSVSRDVVKLDAHASGDLPLAFRLYLHSLLMAVVVNGGEFSVCGGCSVASCRL